MKKFYTYGIQDNTPDKPINESFGALILGLLAVLGITLTAAVRSCANSYDTDPAVDPEDFKNAQQQLREYNEGTRKTYEEMLKSIEEAKKKEEEEKNKKGNDKGDDKGSPTPPPIPTNNDNAETKDGEKGSKEGEETPNEKGVRLNKDDKPEEETSDDLSKMDPKDKYTKQLIDVINVLKLNDDALKDKSSKVKFLFDYLCSTGTINKEIEEENKNVSKEGKIETTDINHVMSHFVAKYYMSLRDEDKKTYEKLFKDAKTLSGIQELICLQMILHNNDKTTLEKGTYSNLGKILEVL